MPENTSARQVNQLRFISYNPGVTCKSRKNTVPKHYFWLFQASTSFAERVNTNLMNLKSFSLSLVERTTLK